MSWSERHPPPPSLPTPPRRPIRTWQTRRRPRSPKQGPRPASRWPRALRRTTHNPPPTCHQHNTPTSRPTTLSTQHHRPMEPQGPSSIGKASGLGWPLQCRGTGSSSVRKHGGQPRPVSQTNITNATKLLNKPNTLWRNQQGSPDKHRGRPSAFATRA
eukprot:scaffold102676_cov31-Tisochrysis_lutea.AAC.1